MGLRTLAATVALKLLIILATPLVSQEDRVSFKTTEGTWVSLDVNPDGKSLVFELLGEVYTLPLEGGLARPVLTGRAFQSQPRLSPNGLLIAYVSDESGTDNIWISRADGSGHGFKLGPALGEFVADRVIGKKEVDPFFALSRFNNNLKKKTQFN